MNIETQSGYLVVEKPTLKQRLYEKGLDDEAASFYQAVLTSSAIDEDQVPGMPTVIDFELKKAFVHKHVYVFMDSKQRAEAVLGKFESEIHLFEEYWELKPVYCINVPIEIEYE